MWILRTKLLLFGASLVLFSFLIQTDADYGHGRGFGLGGLGGYGHGLGLYAFSNLSALCILRGGSCLAPGACVSNLHHSFGSRGYNQFICNVTTICCLPFTVITQKKVIYPRKRSRYGKRRSSRRRSGYGKKKRGGQASW